MILTVCLSPCVDVTIEVDALNVGRANLVRSKTCYYTGKAINVAIGVTRLHKEAFSTGFMYEENSEPFERALEREGVGYDFVRCPGRVRENYKCIDKKSMLTEINDVGASVSGEKLVQLLEKVRLLSAEAEVTVISGGLPKGVDPDYYRELFRAVDRRSLPVVDTEGDRLLFALEGGARFVKPNLDELQNTLGRVFSDKADMLAGCAELLDRGARQVMLSLGRQGAVITDGSRSYYCKSINVAVNSTVGAGDGMVAAAAVGLTEGAPMPELLRAAVAAGTATVTTFGTTSFQKEKYEEIYRGLTVTEI